MLALAARIRALADDVWAAAGIEHGSEDEAQWRRYQALRAVAGELHRVARMVEQFVERGGAS